MEHRRARPDEAAAGGRRSSRRLQRPLRAGRRCCTSARASGIPASRCRAGRSAATGGRTACRSGATEALIADETDDYGHRRRGDASASSRALAERARRRSRRTSSRRTKTSGTTCGASGGCRSTSIRSKRELDEPTRSARAWRSVFEQGLDHVGRLRAAAASAASRRRGRGWKSGPWFLRARAPVPDPGRLADGLPAAARLAALGDAGATSTQIARGRSVRAARPAAAAPARRPRRRASRARRRARPRRRPRQSRRSRRRAANRPPASSAPRSASSRATAAPRLHAAARIDRRLPRPGRRRRSHRGASSRCRSSSKATRRRTIRGSNHLKVTPDPGVIEVNIHPAHSWDELVDDTTDALRRSARSRGSAPRSSCSTAGTPAPAAATTSSSAAPTPADSPFLRRPDLLRSLVGYWHNHPSLSYLFSGLFIGPTSQAPARRRSAQRRALRAGDRVRAGAAEPATRRRRGWSTASSATCWSTSPATRTAPSSASTSSTRPTRHAAAWAWSSCARSRCRRTRG